MIKFKDEAHRMRYAQLLARAVCNIEDTRTASLLYTIAGCDVLYKHVDCIYNFLYGTADVHMINSGVIPLYTTEWCVLEFAYSLYFTDYPVDIQTIFTVSNAEYFDLMFESVRLRFAE